MASITTSQFLDGGTARTAGEAHAISNGARLTIRTDTRIHANAPALMKGSLSSPTFTGLGGELYIDSSSVREISYTAGSGTVPAIGTIISQGGVSGYFLGLWNSLGQPPISYGAAVTSVGIIKFREVTGGSFSAGELTGISATCSDVDRPSWIEIAWDAGVNFSVGRLGKFTTRDGGNWYEVGTTNGSVGQTLLTPTTSSNVTNNFNPGCWVETSPGSDDYEFWPGLSSAANGWVKTALGFAEGLTDKRGQFVKTFGYSQLTFGESANMSGTYALVAGQVSTYVDISHTTGCIYTLINNEVTVTTGVIPHLFEIGQLVYHDFTTGTATDGTYTITEIIDANSYKFNLTSGNTSGNVTVRPGVTVTLPSHGMNEGEKIYADFTTGTGVDGVYNIYAITGANSYLIEYPHSIALTGGNVTVNSKVLITATAHGMAIGNEVYCYFTTGDAVSYKYIMRTISANTIEINYPFVTGMLVGDVTLKWTIGHVPPAGCRVRIGNIIWSEVTSANRETNSVPNVTISSRPEFLTTLAGTIDLEGLYVQSGRSIFDQAFSVRLHRCAFSETLQVTECATALDIGDVGVGQYSSQDAKVFQFTSNFSGGTVGPLVGGRAYLGSADHATEIIYCSGIIFNGIKTGIINYLRNTGYSLLVTTCRNLVINNAVSYNGNIPISSSINITVNNVDYVDRLIGRTNATSPYSAVTVGSGCDGITIDGFSTGLGNTIDDCHPYSNLISISSASNVNIRNIGSVSNYCKTGVYYPNKYSTGIAILSFGNCNNLKIQRCFIGKLRTGLLQAGNSDNNVLVEHVLSENPWMHSSKSARGEYIACLNSDTKCVSVGAFSSLALTSVYGTHWTEQFLGVTAALTLIMNEPSAKTSPYYSNPQGAALFNSSGGIEMRYIGAQAIWEMPYFALGHTGFINKEPVMYGGTITNYILEYQIDIGSGWNGNWKTLTGSNLYNEVISPTTGFKVKIRVTTSVNNSTAITLIRLHTSTTKLVQQAISYPLDVNTITFTGLPSGSDMVILESGTTNVLYQVDSYSGTNIPYTYSGADVIDIGFIKPGYVPFYIRNLSLTTADSSIPVSLTIDRNYS